MPILWLAADQAVTTNGSNQVLTWGDQSMPANDALASTDGVGSDVPPELVQGIVNFNPAIRFDCLIDRQMQLIGSMPLGLDDGSGNVDALTVFIVTYSRDDEGAFCGSDIFNFFNDDGAFEIETIGPNGCSAQTAQQTVGVFNGGEYFLSGEININEPSLIAVKYDGFPAVNPGTNTGQLTSFVDGAEAMQNELIGYNEPETSSGPYPAGETVFDFDRPYSIGQAPINTSAGTEVNDLPANMDFAEVIIYKESLSQADRERVNTYLAIKYGIQLAHDPLNSAGTNIFDTGGAFAGFDSDVFGVGRDDASGLDQKQSASTAGGENLLTIGVESITASNQTNPATLTDGDYLLVGDNGVELNFLGTGGPATPAFANILGRQWRVSEFQGGVAGGDAFQDLDLAFDKDLFGIDGPDDSYVLLIDVDGNFADATGNPTPIFGMTVGDDLVFTGVDLDHLQYFTLARPSCSVTPDMVLLDCDPATNLVDIEVVAGYDYAYLGSGGSDEITLTAFTGQSVSATLTGASVGTTTLPVITVPAGIGEISISASFGNDATCRFDLTRVIDRCDAICTPAADEIAGTIYADLNFDGLFNAVDLTVPLATITLYDDDGIATTNEANPQVSPFTGNYSFTGLTPGTRYRVEVVPPGTGTTSAFSADGSGSNVLFVEPGICTANFGGTSPDICDPEEVQYVAFCYNSIDPTVMPTDALISFKGTGGGSGSVEADYVNPPERPVNVSTLDIGSGYGIGYNRFTQHVYAGAFVKGNAFLAPGATPGSIFFVDNNPNEGNNGDVNSATEWIDLNDPAFYNGALGDIDNDDAIEIEDGVDDKIYRRVGRTGLGDVEVSQDGTKLFAVDLRNRRLLTMPIDADGTAPASAAEITAVQIPDAASCPVGDTIRPFAIGIRPLTGAVYVGAVCDASVSQDRANLQAYVFEYDVDGETFNTTPVLEFDLDYDREDNNYSGVTSNWQPWELEYTTDNKSFSVCCGNFYFLSDPMPMLTDITFADNSNMTLGFNDRFANALTFLPEGTTNNPAPGSAGILPAGETLAAGLSGPASWQIENNGSVTGLIGGTLTSQDNDGGGPGGNEFYFNDGYPNFSSHTETHLGSQAQLVGQPLATTAWDPVHNVPGEYGTGGVNFASNITGDWIKGFKLYENGDAGTAGKGAGFGDIEGLCEDINFVVGNLVFADDNDDGVQDPSEMGIPGLPVALYLSDGTLLATTTTNADGNYVFSSPGSPGQSWVDPNGPGLEFQDSVIVVFGTDGMGGASPYDPATGLLTVNGMVYEVSDRMIGEGANPNQNDSDVTYSGAGAPFGGNFPFTGIRIEDISDYNFDAGFALVCPFVDLVDVVPPTCGTDTLLLAGLVDSIFAPDTYDYTWDTEGDGMFLDANNAETMDYSMAVAYVPGAAERTSGAITLSLAGATASTPASCTDTGDMITITIQNVDCGSFFWNGEDD